ncbi:MAG TPA: AraC family transcriptional regulator [Polyangiaceae bacterium]|nr:AraC family transcriptional regulator [Polyangiaceae bacterium]
MRHKKPTPAEAALWRRRSFDVQRSEAVARHLEGPEPPRIWSPRLNAFIDASRRAEEGPSWWTPLNAYFGSVETRTDPHSYYWDGMKRIGRRDLPLVFFQFTLAGFGHFELYGRPAQRITPGTGFFAVVPSRHRYYLPEASPGWTFVWIGIYHRYLVRRIERHVATVGPVVRATPRSPLVARLSRLVRGAFLKDFRDRFEVEAELFAFTHAFERLRQPGYDPEADRLLDQVRARVLAQPEARLDVATLAAEHGMSRSAFGHYFHARTGATPAHFMTEVRVQAAARLLVTTRLPLARIADDCGFANANHFGKVFRRYRHQSAGAYRRSLG